MSAEYERRKFLARLNSSLPPDQQACYRCREVRDAEDFCVNRARPNGLNSICRSCRSEVGKIQSAKPRTMEQVRKSRSNGLRWKYGITADEWDEIFESQGKLCKLCGSESPNSKNGWQTDHLHGTEKIRGILCLPCNVVLGFIEKLGWGVPGLERFYEYMENNK